jgi:tetratricopeptide (TPR) repeat protein
VQSGDQAMADRYAYLPSVGIFIIVAYGAAEITSKLRYQKIALGTLAAFAFAALSVCTRVQVTYWQNGATLFKHALEVTKNNDTIQERYATAVLKEGKFDEAISHYRQALNINPELHWAYVGMGLAFEGLGKTDEAIECFEAALRLEPGLPRALNYLGTVLEAQGKNDEAIENFNKSIRSDPDYLYSYCNAARLKMRQKEYVQAIEYYEEALERKPDWPEVCSELGEAYSSLGKETEAVFYWHRALELKPNDIRVLNNLTWILATAEDETIRNPSEAVEYAKRLSELVGSNQQPMFLDTMAAAYAAAGNFPEAVRTAEQAVELLETDDKKDLVEEVRERLELYKSGRPYRER